MLPNTDNIREFWKNIIKLFLKKVSNLFKNSALRTPIDRSVKQNISVSKIAWMRSLKE